MRKKREPISDEEMDREWQETLEMLYDLMSRIKIERPEGENNNQIIRVLDEDKISTITNIEELLTAFFEGQDVTIKGEVKPETGYATVKVTGKSFVVKDVPLFIKILSLADHIDLYSLSNNNIELCADISEVHRRISLKELTSMEEPNESR